MSSWPYYTKYRLRAQERSGVCGYFVREFAGIAFGSLLALSARRIQISCGKSYSFHFDDSMPFGDFSQIRSVIFPKSIRWFRPLVLCLTGTINAIRWIDAIPFGELTYFRSVNWHVLVRSNVNISFGRMLNATFPMSSFHKVLNSASISVDVVLSQKPQMCVRFRLSSPPRR